MGISDLKMIFYLACIEAINTSMELKKKKRFRPQI